MFWSSPVLLSESLCGWIPDPISCQTKQQEQTPTGTQCVLVTQELHYVRGGALGDKTWRHYFNICLRFAIGSYLNRKGEYFLKNKLNNPYGAGLNVVREIKFGYKRCCDLTKCLCVFRSVFPRSVLSWRLHPLPAVSTGNLPARSGTHLLLCVRREPGHQAQWCCYLSGVWDQRCESRESVIVTAGYKT